MTRHPRQSNVEQVERMLDDGLDIDEIAVALRLTEREVGRIAGLLAERGPADPAPDVDVAALAAAADEVLTVDDDGSAAATRAQVKAATLLCRRATSQDDLHDLAGMLGVRHAVEPAERWLNARARAAAGVVQRCYCAPHPCSCDDEGGNVYPAEADETHPADVTPVDTALDAAVVAGLITTGEATATRAVEAALLAGAPWPLALEAAATVALDRDPDYGTHVVEGPVKVQQPDGTWADVTVAEDRQSASYTVTQAGEHVLHLPGAPPLHADPFVLAAESEHVHDPFVAWRPDGVPYATCTCGVTWERQTCTECPAIVAALWVAQHGPTHKHCAANKTTAERTNP